MRMHDLWHRSTNRSRETYHKDLQGIMLGVFLIIVGDVPPLLPHPSVLIQEWQVMIQVIHLRISVSHNNTSTMTPGMFGSPALSL